MSKLKIAHVITTTVLAIGLSALAYHLLSRRYSVLKAQDVAPEDFEKATVERFLIEDKNHDNSQRLKRACELTREDTDLGGFLAFTTFERHLRTICKAVFPEMPKDRGLLNLVKKLRSSGILTREHYEKIKFYICDVRNPLIHSGVYCPEKLNESLVFIRGFIDEFPLSRFSS